MKKIIFALSIALILSGFGTEAFAQTAKTKKKTVRKKSGTTVPVAATAPCKEDENTDPYASVSGENQKPPKIAKRPCPPANGIITPLRIISKPSPGYTAEARKNYISGTIRLRVTFLPSGMIGNVVPLNGLSFGLTERAMAAAKQIVFEPQRQGGVPVAVTRIVEYNFTAY